MDEWEARAGRPSADGQVVSFRGVKSERSEGVVRTVMGQVERENVERMLECVDEGKVRLNGSRIDFGVATKPSTLAEHQAQVAHLVVDTLQQVASSTPLLVDYDLRHPFLDPSSFDLTPAVKPFAFFPLQAHYLALADALTHRLGPYIAIHWRMETLDPSSLHACADALLEHLLRLKQTNAELRSVYFATDYPVDGLLQRDGKVGRLAHSGTFTKSLTEEHERVMRGFVEDFGTTAERLGLRLTTFALEVEELRKGRTRRLPFGHGHSTPVLGLDNGSLDNLLADSSTSSLVDSLVAQRADIFLAGLPSFRGQESKACGKYSSFTSRIEQARKEVLGIERTVRYFERVLEAGGE